MSQNSNVRHNIKPQGRGFCTQPNSDKEGHLGDHGDAKGAQVRQIANKMARRGVRGPKLDTVPHDQLGDAHGAQVRQIISKLAQRGGRETTETQFGTSTA